jgi:peptide/nickel transport system substrate-binding protein
MDANPKDLRGNVILDYEVSADGTTFTFTMREGLKWSDGVPVTTEDVRFTFEDVHMNDELQEFGWDIMQQWMRTGNQPDGEPMLVEVIDDYTFQVSFPEPYPGFINSLAVFWGTYRDFLKPKHHLMNFHPEYTSSDKLKDALAEAGLEDDEWYKLFLQEDHNTWEKTNTTAVDFPSLCPWIISNVTPTVTLWERNPYYFKVDTEGQQLPYIDKHQMVFVSNAQNNAIRMMAGDLDFFLDGSVLKDVPLYKENESKGGYRTLLTPVHFHYATVWLNHTHADPAWRQMVSELRFRQALNLAINRDEIIDSVYIGLVGKPKVFAPAEYDQARANQLLDAVGLDQRNADGWRLGPDGKVFAIPFESSSYMGDEPLVAELIVEHLREVGLQASTKTIDGGLWGQRLRASELKASVNRNHGVMWSIPVFDDLLPGSRGWGNAWQKWYTSGGVEGEEPPAGVQRLYKLREEMMLVKPGTPEDQAIVDEMFSLIKENLWFINVVEDETWPMLASTRLANIPHAGSGAAITFSAEQWFFDS